MVRPCPTASRRSISRIDSPSRPLLHQLDRRRPGHQQQQIGVLRARDPHLLAAHDVAVAAARGGRFQLRGVGAGRRLGDAERLQAELAAGDLRQVVALLRLGAVPQQRAHGVHLGVARAGVAAAVVDFLEDDRRLADAEAGTAVGLGNQRRQIPGAGQGLDECIGVGAGRVEAAPVTVRKGRAQVADRLPQILVKFGARHAP